MVRELYDKIKDNIDLRKNLIELKKELKEEDAKAALLLYIGKDYNTLLALLSNEDAKVRKNVALIMGELAVDEFLISLYEAYVKETKLFVKSDYLIAIEKYDYREYLPKLKLRMEELISTVVEENTKKHIEEEMRILSRMLLNMERPKFHTFTGYDVCSNVVLLTNRNHKEITSAQIKEGTVKELNAGICVKTDKIKPLLDIRTYSELLFMLESEDSFSNNVEALADELLNAGLVKFLEKRHEEDTPFYFRIELKNDDMLDRKSNFTKKLSMAIEEKSKRKLINSTSHYEVELRLIEDKYEKYHFLIKLYTLADDRFNYRKNALPVSIRPVNAALIVKLAEKYLVEDAQIIDPFCGVGTMLIERNKLVYAKTMYGIDSFSDAIIKGRENSKKALANIYFINRDFFDFKHDYLFDEVISNLPSSKGKNEEIEQLYGRFFATVTKILKPKSILILYSDDRRAFLRQLKSHKRFHVEEMFEISAKEGTNVFVVSYTA